MDSQTVTFEIARTVEDKYLPAARAALEAVLEEKDRTPDAVVREITIEPAAEERSRPLHASVLHINCRVRPSQAQTSVVARQGG